MSDITQPDNQTDVGVLETAKMQVKDLMSSKFALVAEAVVLPTNLDKIPVAKESPSDVMFRDEVNRVLPTVLENEGNVLIIQNIATQHAIATMSVFLEAGLDTYFTFIPENQSIRPPISQSSYYHPTRVMEVALENEERIKKAKDNLERDKLRGIVVAIDAHARYEDENGEFDRFLPTEEKLKELVINRIVLMGEFPPRNAQGLTERRIDSKEDWDKNHMYDYLREMKSKGCDVSLIGIDSRH